MNIVTIFKKFPTQKPCSVEVPIEEVAAYISIRFNGK